MRYFASRIDGRSGGASTGTLGVVCLGFIAVYEARPTKANPLDETQKARSHVLTILINGLKRAPGGE